jgi:hypothetical protein
MREPAPALDVEQYDWYDTGDYASSFAIPHQKRPRWPIVIAMIIAAILVTGGVIYFVAHQQVSAHDEQRRAAYQLLDEAIALTGESDIVVIKLDSALKETVTSTTIPDLNALLEKASDSQRSLETAAEKATEAIQQLDEATDTDLAQHVINAIACRLQMLEDGKVLVQLDIAAFTSLELLNESWGLLVAADGETREAIGSLNYPDALALNEAALEKLNQAQTQLEAAQTAFTQVDFQAVFNLIALKREAVELVIAVDVAILEGNYEEAGRLNDEFLEKSNVAAAAARALPSVPADLINAAYDTETTQVREHYETTRSQTVGSDEFIRNYVGINAE